MIFRRRKKFVPLELNRIDGSLQMLGQELRRLNIHAVQIAYALMDIAQEMKKRA